MAGETGDKISIDMPWEDAIKHVLSEADGTLHYAEIAERITSSGLRRNVGATPASTVASYLSTSLRSEGENSPYLRVGRGEYTLKKLAVERNAEVVANTNVVQQEEGAGALGAFGMFWRRDSILWTGKQLLGRQGAGATNVSFANQIGVYLLHDVARVIYVGRADDTLFSRLKAHTTDRLGGRWDRFSWFGLRSVLDNGELSTTPVPWSQNVVVETMEALLIESLEPPLNRRRGDNFSAAEYLQVPDPQIEKEKKKALLDEMAKGVY
jgi:hypothetical protein